MSSTISVFQIWCQSEKKEEYHLQTCGSDQLTCNSVFKGSLSMKQILYGQTWQKWGFHLNKIKMLFREKVGLLCNIYKELPLNRWIFLKIVTVPTVFIILKICSELSKWFSCPGKNVNKTTLHPVNYQKIKLRKKSITKIFVRII